VCVNVVSNMNPAQPETEIQVRIGNGVLHHNGDLALLSRSCVVVMFGDVFLGLLEKIVMNGLNESRIIVKSFLHNITDLRLRETAVGLMCIGRFAQRSTASSASIGNAHMLSKATNTVNVTAFQSNTVVGDAFVANHTLRWFFG
jgi:hypothetical protein